MSPVALYQKYAVVFPFGSPPVFAALLRSDVGETLVTFNVVVVFFLHFVYQKLLPPSSEDSARAPQSSPSTL